MSQVEVPDDKMNQGLQGMSATTDRALGRSGARSLRYLQIGVQAAIAEAHKERLPVQVAFALDRSGSMGGEKMVLARQAVVAALQQLQAGDHFAVTVFDDRVDVVAAGAPVTPQTVMLAQRALDGIEARGSTALHAGWDTACGELARVQNPQAIGRCIVVTDGQANHGPSSVLELSEAARRRRALGIATTALGIGEDFNEELLAAMSKAGAGQFYYVRKAAQLAAILAAEINDAMDVVARGVVVELWPSQGVRLELLSDYPAIWTGTHLRVELGDLVSDQCVDLIVTALLPRAADGDPPSVEARLSDADGPLELPVQLVSWRLANHRANDEQPRDFGVLRAAAAVVAARALLGVLERNRRGEFNAVRRRLDEAIAQLANMGKDDPEIRAHMQRLVEAREQLSHFVEEMALKEMHMVGTQVARSNLSDGSRVKSSMR